jgi:sterol desaturase/sphingolipid hydroxylase (fatty acid hydroxylase superfamily)
VLKLICSAETLLMTSEVREANKKDTLSSITIGVVAAFINASVQGILFFVYTAIFQFRFFDPGQVWWVWILCFFADDLSYYWYHRCSHEIRFFWASHVVHHSSERFNLAAGVRLPWTSYLTGTFLFWAWMPLIGISPGMLILFKSAGAVYQFWLHTEKIQKMPTWFEAVFNSPSHHRVHHASNVEYLDKNHAGTLILWDKLFGTFQKETVTPKYGLTKNIGSYNPITVAFYEWKNIAADLKKAKSLNEGLNFVFNAPGWKNNDAYLTRKNRRRRNDHAAYR